MSEPREPWDCGIPGKSKAFRVICTARRALVIASLQSDNGGVVEKEAEKAIEEIDAFLDALCDDRNLDLS